jgi:hypothetical protein
MCLGLVFLKILRSVCTECQGLQLIFIQTLDLFVDVIAAGT